MSRLLLYLVPLLVAFPVLSPAVRGETSPPEVTGEAAREPAVEAEKAEGPVTCYWRSLIPESDFRLEAGEVYRITVDGDDRENLTFSYTRLRPHQGEARIAVQTRRTPDNRILIDGENPGLFTAETGEFTLSVVVPAGWPIFLAEDIDHPYAEPVILSNIEKLP